MADLITLWDGRTELVFDKRDMLSLVYEYMGTAAVRWLEEEDRSRADMEKDYDDLWKEYEKQREEHRNAIREIQAEIDKMQQESLSRKAVADGIKTMKLILWRELR